MSAEERIAALESEVSQLKEHIHDMRGHATQLAELTSMVKEIMNRLDTLASGGFVRCAERGQIIENAIHRINRLEDGEIKEIYEIKAQLKTNTDEIQKIEGRLTPLEKRILIWVGGIGVISFIAPHAIRFLMNLF